MRWAPALLMVVGLLPLMVALSAWEFAACGRGLNGAGMTFPTALRVVVVGTAANFLPLPGSALVRVVGFRSAGATYRSATAMVALLYVFWLAVALLYSGAWTWALGSRGVALGFLAGGAAALAVGLVGCRWLKLGHRLIGFLLGIRLALVLCEAARLQLSFDALGLEASFAQASALSVSGVLGSAFSIVPSGLGISEFLAAILSGPAGVSPANGFLVAAFSRLVMLAVLLPVGAVLALRPARQA